MAIKDFKNIIDRKGYLVDSEDRKIFEKEISKSNFGLGCSDMIEFILYDSTDNQLPQGDDGKLVRYIHIDDVNIKDYFILSESLETKKKNDTSEFIVDLEKLIREAGYSNGIFKTQVTLLNRRAGSDLLDGNNMWIHEIAPSRTEIRILPNRSTKLNTDLEKRYKNFTDNHSFRDDVIYYVTDYVNSLNFEKIFKSFKLIKGKETDGEIYISLIQKEFGIDNFEAFLNRIKTKVIESMTYYSQNRNWKVDDNNYGNPIIDKLDCITLSVKDLQKDIQQSIISCIDFYLPKRDIQIDNILTREEQITIDKLKEILKTTTSDSIYDTTEPDEIEEEVEGCTDPTSQNYNPLATINDGSCVYESVLGCMDPTAENYNPLAKIDDGSCTYGTQELVKKTYYIWSDFGSISYIDTNNDSIIKEGIEYDSFICVHIKNSVTFEGDVREVPKLKDEEVTYVQYIATNTIQDYYYMDNEGTRVILTYINRQGQLQQTIAFGPRETVQFCSQKDTVYSNGINDYTLVEQGSCGSVSIGNPPIGGGGGRDIPIPGQEEVVIDDINDIQYQ
tara:strand:- start:407 stop:2086 length:1680 start_codon:yes stop_codon:yes gene_type:complete